MPDFRETQRSLIDKRAALETAQRALFRTTDQISQVEKQLADLGRFTRDGDQQQRAALEAKRRRLIEAREQNETVLGRAHGELADIYPAFWETWSDPRTNIGRMNDDTPLMLFPLRLETRFKAVAGPRGTQIPQLWVRVYPDECLIDTFDETLAETELDSANIFWREYFHAAGVEVSERAAYRGLVASHGSGRAAWIIKHYQPLNPEEKPQSIAAGEVILVVSSDSVLPNGETTALTEYWSAVWKAGGDANMEAAAQAMLIGAVGATRAAELVDAFRPYNLTEAPPATFTRQTATVRVSYLVLPKRDDVDAKSRSWMRAASARLLPERFVLLGFLGGKEVLNQLGEPVRGPFAVTPDPNTSAESQFQFDEHGNLALGDDLRWMTGFDEAVKRGMGFRVNLTPETARGFDRLFVLGVRLSSDATQSKSELEALLQHHYFSRSGFSFLPQGSATNNTEEGNSAYSREDDADTSYDFVFKDKAQFTETDEWLDKSDGQWFAESLGLDTEWLKQVPHAGAVDQTEARAMNTALWPATLGYFMDTLLQPVLNDDEIYYTRWFFSRFVSGRGMIPAIRIGRQPYGILPASAFSRARWIFGQEAASYTRYASRYQEQRGTPFKDWLWKLKGVLDQLHNRWRNLATQVSHVDQNTNDPQQTLLDIVGLHPASVEFHQRYANTKQQEHNLAAIWNLYIPWASLPANELHNEAYDILATLGYTESQVPLLFDLFWKVSANRLDGPVIQEGALSETDPLRAVTTSNRNYIEWLREWASRSFDTIRLQDGFQANQWPNALLYILLKHALELGYHDAGVRVLDDAALIDADAKLELRKEPHFFHVASATAVKSKYQMLYSPSEAITGDSRTLLVDHITRNIDALFGSRFLSEQLRALAKLERTPTARLERLLGEHLDCCTYRLDAWLNGLLNFQLASMRYPGGENEAAAEHRKGIYLGAYGWLESVHPENKTLTPVRLEGDLDEIFNQQQPEGESSPLMRDDKNEGYIHAPSVNHAVTAAVLRNGYIAHATPTQPDLLKVNLSSERVRLALGVIEGIRNGQSLAALLGYQFERGLHDRHAFAECDQFIYPLRLVFPLYTQPESVPDGVSIESIEARNVVNGLNFVRHVKNATDANKSYPFGFPTTKLPAATAAQRDAINAEANRLLDIHDALADLAIAEGVHQVVMGNYDRAAATMDAYSQATFPPVPDVVQTPRSGIALTHRVGLHFDTNVPIAAGDNPRIKAEPAMNRWVITLVPDLTRIGCTVHYLDPAGAENTALVTCGDMGLQPLDLLYVMNPDNLEPRSELEDRIRNAVLQNAALAVRPDLVTRVDYGKGAPGDFSFLEVAPIVRSLRALLMRSRSLRANDIALPTEAKTENASILTLARTRADFLEAELEAFKNGPLHTLQTELEGVLPDAGPATATILADIDDYVDDIIAACAHLARYGLPQTGFGIFHEGRAGIFKTLLNKAADVAARWQRRLDDYDALMSALPTLVDEAERIALLLRAEQQISTSAIDAEGLTSAQVLALVQAKELAFRARHGAFRDFHETSETTLTGVLAAFKLLLPVADFDSQETTTSAEEQQIVALAQDVLARVQQLAADLEKRIAALHAKLEEHDGVTGAEKRVQLVTEAARAVLGDEFVLVPQFTLPEKQAAEWANAYDDREQLLKYQKDTLDNEFPVDDWLYGAARVREKLHHVENLTFVTEALGTAAPELRPVQFPYGAEASWMALQYPPESKGKLERELLLYTAHYASDFDGTRAQCGLLLDEWTEVVPADTETTGLTFHFDKPNSEPPQTILLATPTQFTGEWSWSDLVATLHETLDLARIRAVEPKQLDKDPLSVFLPATILATTWQPITIAADLSLVNKYASKLT